MAAEPMMTGRQQSYIIRLCNQIANTQHGYLSQCQAVHGWGSFKLQRGVTLERAGVEQG